MLDDERKLCHEVEKGLVLFFFTSIDFDFADKINVIYLLETHDVMCNYVPKKQQFLWPNKLSSHFQP